MRRNVWNRQWRSQNVLTVAQMYLTLRRRVRNVHVLFIGGDGAGLAMSDTSRKAAVQNATPTNRVSRTV